MSTLTSYVTDFDDINFRVGFHLGFIDLGRDLVKSEITKQLDDFISSDELDPALTEFFASRNETALQIKYAKTLVEHLLNSWLPQIKFIGNRIHDLQNITTDIKLSETGEVISVTDKDLTDSQRVLTRKNYQELERLRDRLKTFNAGIIDRIRQFAPDLYKQHRNTFSEYVKLKEHEMVSVADGAALIEPNVKLQWNGTNRALYDLFAQLSLSNGKHSRPLIGNTIAGLAQFLSKNVEGLPDAATVERELQKMREPHGSEKAKRDRIDINITRDTP